MNNSVWFVSYRNRVLFDFDCNDEAFYLIHAFSS